MKWTQILFLTAAVLFMVSAVSAEIITDTTDLPPDGDYVAPDEYHSYSAIGIILDDPVHTPFVETTERIAI